MICIFYIKNIVILIEKANLKCSNIKSFLNMLISQLINKYEH